MFLNCKFIITRRKENEIFDENPVPTESSHPTESSPAIPEDTTGSTEGTVVTEPTISPTAPSEEATTPVEEATCANGVYDNGFETTSHAAQRLGAIFTVNGCCSAPFLDYPVIRSGVLCNGSGRNLWVPAVYSSTTGLLQSAWETGGTNGNPGDIWIVISEGRCLDGESAGLTYSQCARLLAENGCTFGVPLDGGGSSTMVFQGEVLNSAKGRERSLVDFVYFK